MSRPRKRAYASAVRTESASETRRRILSSAKALFGRKGIDGVTIDDVAKKAGTSASSVYAIYKSKDGVLRALMQQSLFGTPFQSAQSLLEGVTDPVRLVELTSHVSRAIYESESSDLGLLRHASGFSPALRRIEQEFERLRYEMQEDRLQLLFSAGKARTGLSFTEAQRILWMFTSRDVYRMMVLEGGWTPDQYQAWLSQTLLEALVEGGGRA
ncbi:MAG: TetR/AcrR family transcriptional regulator [Vicinamibacterales bacterium]